MFEDIQFPSISDKTIVMHINKVKCGDLSSMFNIGLKFAHATNGFPYNEKYASRLISESAKRGYQPAKKWIDDYYYSNIPVVELCKKILNSNSTSTQNHKKVKKREKKECHSNKAALYSVNRTKSGNSSVRQDNNNHSGFYTALCKINGITCQKSYSEGLKMMINAVKNGDVDAIGWFTKNPKLNSEFYKEGIKIMMDAAYNGNSHIIDWFYRHPEVNRPEVCHMLGMMYLNGTHVPKSLDLAKEQFLKEERTPSNMYYLGLASITNLSEAVSWFCKSEKNGDKNSRKWISDHINDTNVLNCLMNEYVQGYRNSVFINTAMKQCLDGNREFFEVLKQEILNENSKAFLIMGILYKEGIIVEQSLELSKKYFEKSCEPMSHFHLASI